MSKIDGYDVFPDQAITKYGDLIYETMIAESKPINLDQALNYSNWLATMKEELKAIEKNRTCELQDKSVNKKYIWCKMGL
jgi:hypothetical protein